MDLANTYFDFLPRELLYEILHNSDMIDICAVLGYDFYKNHKQLFDSIIKKDFGKDIRTDLIETSLDLNVKLSTKMVRSIYKYTHFLLIYLGIISTIKNLQYNNELHINVINDSYTVFLGLKKLGINLMVDRRKMSLYDRMKFMSSFYILRSSSGSYYLKVGVSSLTMVGVDLHSIYNLIFFLSDQSIFDII